MFFLNKRSNFEKKPHELSYRSNIILKTEVKNKNEIINELRKNHESKI